MHKLFYFLVCIAFLIFQSCSFIQKKSLISDFDSFISKVEFNYKTFKEKDWNEADLKFKKLTEVDYVKCQQNLTDDENAHINTLIGKYEALKIKAAFLDGKNKIKNLIQQGSTIVNEIVSDSTILK